MTAQIIDGKREAVVLRGEITEAAARFRESHGYAPTLAVVLVGDDPASHVYVGSKTRQAAECGLGSKQFTLPAATTETDLLTLIDSLNADDSVHGILVQLPLPAHISAADVLGRIDPRKDVDGFHPLNAGMLAIGDPALVPCTPSGCLRLIKTVRPDLRGLSAVVIGRSTIVGRPMAQLLLLESCTVTIAHSATRGLPDLCRTADILVASIGKPGFVRGGWIKPGATVIDVGINRIAGADGKPALTGDVAFAEAALVAGAITPVPGGVGPMTVATLLANTLICAERQAGR
jgi:methylenetetrahydrofolate dehydrogenase (NADP+)/methenyltetrahydrofolate cyclohydrolase